MASRSGPSPPETTASRQTEYAAYALQQRSRMTVLWLSIQATKQPLENCRPNMKPELHPGVCVEMTAGCMASRALLAVTHAFKKPAQHRHGTSEKQPCHLQPPTNHQESTESLLSLLHSRSRALSEHCAHFRNFERLRTACLICPQAGDLLLMSVSVISFLLLLPLPQNILSFTRCNRPHLPSKVCEG